jgi:hypothetical protein
MTCLPLIAIIVVSDLILTMFVPEASGWMWGILIIPMMLVDLYLVGKVMDGRWYLEYDENELIYRAIFKTYRYSWMNVSRVWSQKSPAFMGNYHDTLLVTVNGKTHSFFLHDFGLSSKKKTVKFIEDIIETWKHANPTDASKWDQVSPSETDKPDIYDDEY